MLDAIPFEMPNAIPFVVMEARAGGVPARVLLDTGNAAPYAMIVSPALAARAGTVAGDTPQGESRAALGDSPVRFQGARLASFTLGAISMNDLPVAVSPAVDAVGRQLGSPLDAILGHNFVAGRRISIDYGRRLVDFTAEAGPASLAISFTLAPDRPVTLVHATINGRGPYLMVLDSGASTTLIAPEIAAEAGVETGQTVRIGGAGGTVAGGARIGRARIALGRLTRDGQQVAVADLIGPIRAAVGAPIAGVLGADLFGAGRITLDYGTNRLWIEEAGQAN
jgi:anaerobic selenocysteine-containing dehydrogenase